MRGGLRRAQGFLAPVGFSDSHLWEQGDGDDVEGSNELCVRESLLVLVFHLSDVMGSSECSMQESNNR